MSKRQLDAEEKKAKRPRKDGGATTALDECPADERAILEKPEGTSPETKEGKAARWTKEVDAEEETLVDSDLGTPPEVDIKEVKASIAKVESDIKTVERNIEKVEGQVNTASERALQALQENKTVAFEYWRKEEDLRKEKEDLRARLAAKEQILVETGRRAPMIGPSTEGENGLFRPDTDGMTVCIGRDAFHGTVTHFFDIISEKMEGMKSTHALVLRGPSGVGKTFSTLTISSRCATWAAQKERRLVTAYLGFNETMDLSPGEADCIRNGGVEKVVLYRLAQWLVTGLRPSVELQKPDDAVQLQVAFEKPTRAFLDRCHNEHLENTIMTALSAVRVPLALAVLVDEGQILDELHPTKGGPGGARKALNCLRQLQWRVWKQGVILLPVCTGIDPAVSLTDKTTGTNHVVNRLDVNVLTPPEWDTLCKKVLEGKLDGWSENEVRCFIRMGWPRVRPMLQMAKSGELSLLIEDLSFGWGKTEPCCVRQLLQAAADGTELPINDIPVSMVQIANDAGTAGVPVFDLPALRAAALHLAVRGICDFPRVVTRRCVSQGSRYSTFEALGFEVVKAFYAVFYHRGVRRSNDCPLLLPSEATTEVLRRWLPAGEANIKAIVYPEKEMEFIHPFTGTTHSAPRGLSPQFLNAFKTLETHGDAMLMRCGGRAAVDYLLLKKTESAIEVRFGDAKHTGAARALAPEEVQEVVRKAAELHRNLSHHLCNHPSLPPPIVAAFNPHNHVMLVSNRRLAEPIANYPALVMEPSSTKWEPLTQLLFQQG